MKISDPERWCFTCARVCGRVGVCETGERGQVCVGGSWVDDGSRHVFQTGRRRGRLNKEGMISIWTDSHGSTGAVCVFCISSAACVYGRPNGDSQVPRQGPATNAV